MQNFIGFGGVVFVGFLIYLFLQRFSLFNDTVCSEGTAWGWKDGAFWKKVWNRPEMRRRIYLTLGIVVCYKLLIFISTPGVNMAGIFQMVERIQLMAPDHPAAQMSQNPLFSKVYRQFSFFHIGLIPYLSACIFFQFLGVAIRPWRRAMFSRNGRAAVARWTFILAVVLAVIQSLFYAFSLEQMHIDEMMVVPHPGWLFRMGVVLSMTAGFCLVFWLANTITKKGIGNGIAIFVGADMFLKVFSSLWRLFGDIADGRFPFMYYGVAVLAVVFMVLFVVGLTQWRRDLEFQIGETRRCFPMRLSDMASVPVTLAMFGLLLPATISSFADYPLMRSLAHALVRGSIFYYLGLAAFLFLGSYLYMAIIVNPELRARRLVKNQCSLDGRTDEGQIENYFYDLYNRQAMIISMLLFVAVVLPDMVVMSLKIYYLFAGLFGLGTFFILWGVFADTAGQLRSNLARMEQGASRCCYESVDEMDAVVVQTVLASRGIPCVMEALRFTWGLPVLTAGDRFGLYVQENHYAQAAQLIGDMNE